MLDLTEFHKPLVTFKCGGPPHYRRKFPQCVPQTFPMPPKHMSKPQPRIFPENIKQYPVNRFGQKLY